MKTSASIMNSEALRKLEIITKNRVKMTLTLIMIIEYREVYLDELMKYTGFDFSEANHFTRELVRLNLVEVIPTKSLPIFRVIDIEEAKKFIKLLEDNLYLGD